MITENNRILLEGEIVSDFKFGHESFGERFYHFDLSVKRLSGSEDVLPVVISERLVDVTKSAIGANVTIDGQIRSYNKEEDGKWRTILTVFVNSIENTECESTINNEACLHGFLCKEPIYRKTPLGKDICDLIVAVNRPNRRVDYIPCITWGRNAIFSGTLEVGTEVKLLGRFQSRLYHKKYDDDLIEVRTAFELSVKKLEVVKNECED